MTDTLDALTEELETSQPEFYKNVRRTLVTKGDVLTMIVQLQRLIPNSVPKSFRFVGEMEAIAMAYEDVGLEGGHEMFSGAASTYAFVEGTEV